MGRWQPRKRLTEGAGKLAWRSYCAPPPPSATQMVPLPVNGEDLRHHYQNVTPDLVMKAALSPGQGWNRPGDGSTFITGPPWFLARRRNAWRTSGCRTKSGMTIKSAARP